MPSPRLKGVHGYFDPAVFALMEEARKNLRRVSKSRFLEDAVVEKLERMGKYPVPGQGTSRRKNRAA